MSSGSRIVPSSIYAVRTARDLDSALNSRCLRDSQAPRWHLPTGLACATVAGEVKIFLTSTMKVQESLCKLSKQVRMHRKRFGAARTPINLGVLATIRSISAFEFEILRVVTNEMYRILVRYSLRVQSTGIKYNNYGSQGDLGIRVFSTT